MKAAIITSSDSGYAGEREDKSGSVIQEILEANDYEVVHTILLPDDRKMLADEMARIADEGIAELIVTTGGTGFSPRDCMPEATKDIIEREVPGIPEAMRAYSMTITPRAMLSRAAAGIRKGTLIVNLPGSPKAVRESLEYIIPALEHGLQILTGEATNCARKRSVGRTAIAIRFYAGSPGRWCQQPYGKGEVRSAFRWTDIFGDTDRKRMSVGSKTDLNFWISWNTVWGRDCAGSNFRSGSTWRSGELFSKGKDRKMPGAGGRYAAGTCGRTSKSVEVRNGKSRPTGDYAVS